MVQALTIDVEARFAQVLDGLDQLNAKSTKTVAQMESAFGGLKATLAGLAGAFTIGALTDKFTNAVSAMGALDDAAQMTGASVESLSSILNTLAPTGVTLEQIAEAAGKLTKSMQGADEESKGAGAAFAALGINARDASGNLRSVDEVLADVAREFAKYEDGANKVALAQALFGKSGASLLPMLKDLAEQQKASATVSAGQAKAAADLEDAWRKLRVQGDQFAQSVASSIIPALSRLIDEFNIGREAAGGFFNALVRYGLTNPFKSTADQISDAKARIEDLSKSIATNQSRLDTGKIKGGAAEAIQSGIDAAKAEIAQLQRDVDAFTKLGKLRGDIDTANEMTGGEAQRKKQAPKIAGADTGKKGAIDRADLTDEQKAIIDAFKQIEGVQQRAAAAANTLQLLDQMFFEGSITAKQYDDITKAIFKTSETAGDSIIAANERAAQSWVDLIDPAEKYRRQLEEIERLRNAPGGLTGDQADRAAAKILEQISNLSEFAKVMDKNTAGMSDLNAEAAKFGKIVSSAFEDAILQGKSFSSVLKGLAQDIARVLIRDNITNPIASGITGWLSGIGVNRTPNSTPAAANGVFLGEGDMMFGKSIRATPLGGGVTVSPVINIDSRTDQAFIASAVKSAVNQSVGMMVDMQRRGQVA